VSDSSTDDSDDDHSDAIIMNAMKACARASSKPYDFHYTVIEILLSRYGANVNSKDGEEGVLQTAAGAGNAEIVEMLIDRFKADVHLFYDEALHLAIKNGHCELVCTLIQRFKADVHALNDYALFCATENGHADIVEMLIDRFGADVHSFGEAPLRRAVENGHASIVELLIIRSLRSGFLRV